MFESLKKMWKITDLRKKLLYTFFMLILFRLVGVIPAPGVDVARVFSNTNAASLPLLALVNMMTGNNFGQMTIMAMGITPYINASIIMQLLTIAIPALERMQQDESGGGREKIARITRYVTVGLAAVQAIGLVAGLGYIKSGWYNYVLVGVSMAGGTALAMWIGERITEKGIGNGISLLIFAGIISNLFNGIISGFSTAISTGTMTAWINVFAIVVLFLVMTMVITFVDMGERRIPLQISKQVKGRRVYGGQNTHMALKVLSVGVLPLIFAYSFLAFPGTLIQLIGGTKSGAYIWWARYMNSGSFWYLLVSALLIIAFTFFYSSISFDAKKQAEQLIMQGAVIPGQRGKNIRQYLQNTTNRLNLFAALFLAVLATVPTVMTAQLQTQIPFAASSILIAVSVALETIRTIRGEMGVRGLDLELDNIGFM
mgnify:CR=1 FL=1